MTFLKAAFLLPRNLSSPTFFFFLGVPHAADLGVLHPDLVQIRQTVVMILVLWTWK